MSQTLLQMTLWLENAYLLPPMRLPSLLLLLLLVRSLLAKGQMTRVSCLNSSAELLCLDCLE